MTNHWLCITTITNYMITESDNVWGVEKRYESRLNKLKPGDKVIFYLKGRQFGGIFQVKSKPYKDENKIFYGGKFQYRIKLKPIKTPKDMHFLTDGMIKNLDLFKFKDHRWKFELYGKTIMPLSKKDFNHISFKI